MFPTTATIRAAKRDRVAGGQQQLPTGKGAQREWLLYSRIAYAEDIAIVINRKSHSTVSEELETVLGLVWQDKPAHQRKQNRNNTFYHNEALKGPKETTFFGKTIQVPTEVKYSGVTPDNGLTWSAQLDTVTTRAYRAFWACRCYFGKTRGLKPKVVYLLVVHHGDKTRNHLFQCGPTFCGNAANMAGRKQNKK
jgi:hypothetical protein